MIVQPKPCIAMKTFSRLPYALYEFLQSMALSFAADFVSVKNILKPQPVLIPLYLTRSHANSIK